MTKEQEIKALKDFIEMLEVINQAITLGQREKQLPDKGGEGGNKNGD